MTTTTNQHTWIGKDIKRHEDPALLMGTAIYTNDVSLPGMLHAAVLRSPYAHARIVSIDTSAAKKLPGVYAVLTGREATEVIGPLPAFCAEPVVEHAIAVEKVRYAGEAVVVVAAESRYIAEDALELVQIEWESLPPVIDVLEAMKPDAPKVHENLPSNIVFEHVFTFGDVDGDFARADHIIKRHLRWPRATAAPMEPAGAVCQYDSSSGRMEVWSNTNMMSQISGPYTIGSVETGIKAVLTNKNQQGVFRGAGSDVGNWVLERLVDATSDELGIDGIELRRRNLIQPDQFPYKMPTGNVYDSGNYPSVLNMVLQHADLDYWRQEQERARQQGRYIGVGLATCQQRSTYSATEFWFHNPAPATGLTSTPESARIGIGPTGGITVTLFSPFWGNSPETVAAQVVGEEFGVDPSEVSVTYDSTYHGLPGAGPGGSRMTVMLSGALHGAAAKVKEKMFKIAGHLLEANPDDLVLREGRVWVRGTERSLSIADIGMKAYWFKFDLPPGIESGLEGSFTYDHPYTTPPSEDRKDLGAFYPIMSHATHIPVVEVDIKTGEVKFLKYVAVHDVGTVVNPRSLQGQIHGGIAQGIGVSLYEEVHYSPEGQNLTVTFNDYLLPTAAEVPNIEVYHHETPSPFTAYGVKGGGEGGRMVAPPAVTRAGEDALAPFGIRIDELPITPEKIVKWVAQAQTQSS